MQRILIHLIGKSILRNRNRKSLTASRYIYLNRSWIQATRYCKSLRTNWAEFLNNNLGDFLAGRGIVHKLTPSYTPEQNGFIERDVRTVSEAGQTMLIESGLPKEAQAEAFDSAVYMLNRVCSKTSRSTPYEKWFGSKPSVSNIMKFGQRAIVYVQSKDRDKLDAKGENLISLTVCLLSSCRTSTAMKKCVHAAFIAGAMICPHKLRRRVESDVVIADSLSQTQTPKTEAITVALVGIHGSEFV